MKKIEVIENDADMLTVKVGDVVTVYNKAYGNWVDYQPTPEELEAIHRMTTPSDITIEDFPGYVYHGSGWKNRLRSTAGSFRSSCGTGSGVSSTSG